MIKRIVAAIAVGAVCLGLAGCDNKSFLDNDPAQPDNKAGGWYGATHVNFDGRQIPCITWKNGYAGGVSCDWSVSK